MNLKNIIIAAFAALTLVACGGGGSDSNTDSTKMQRYVGNYDFCQTDVRITNPPAGTETVGWYTLKGR